MLLDTRARLDEFVVEVLAERPNQTAEEIQANLETKIGKKYTIQAIYQELRNLRRYGVVIKNGSQYNLWAPWVIRIFDFASKLDTNYNTPESLMTLVPRLGESKTWRFDNLVRVSKFWGQCILALHRHSGSETNYSYAPHQWNHIIHGDTGKKVYESLDKLGTYNYVILGSDKPLDRWAEQYWRHLDTDRHIHSYEESPFSDVKNEHFSVIGNFVVTLKLSKTLTERIEEMYKTVVTPQFMDFRELYSLFSSNSRSSLKIQHNPSKAKQLKKKFSNHFGVGTNE